MQSPFCCAISHCHFTFNGETSKLKFEMESVKHVPLDEQFRDQKEPECLRTPSNQLIPAIVSSKIWIYHSFEKYG